MRTGRSGRAPRPVGRDCWSSTATVRSVLRPCAGSRGALRLLPRRGRHSTSDASKYRGRGLSSAPTGCGRGRSRWAGISPSRQCCGRLVRSGGGLSARCSCASRSLRSRPSSTPGSPVTGTASQVGVPSAESQAVDGVRPRPRRASQRPPVLVPPWIDGGERLARPSVASLPLWGLSVTSGRVKSSPDGADSAKTSARLIHARA